MMMMMIVGRATQAASRHSRVVALSLVGCQPNRWNQDKDGTLLPCGGSSGRAFSSNHEQRQERYRLDVAIVGAPNAGKSQLLNVLTESSVAAVSRKRHTTRHGILGARTVHDDDKNRATQLVFCDTPGYQKQRKERGLTNNHGKKRATTGAGVVEKIGNDLDLLQSATQEMKTVDYTLLVVDAARRMTTVHQENLVSLMMHALHAKGREEITWQDDDDKHDDDSDDEPLALHPEKFGIVFNKVDLVHPKSNLLDLTDQLSVAAEACIDHCIQNIKMQQLQGNVESLETLREEMFPTMFYVSALKEDGTNGLLHHLLSLATPSREWPLDPTETTNLSHLERIEEVIREKLYRCLHQEVPHHITQVNRLFQRVQPQSPQQPSSDNDKNDTTSSDDEEKGKDKFGGVWHIHQDLVVQTKSHYRLVMGSGGGRTLRRIQETAQRDLQNRIFDNERVVLRLHVKLSKAQHTQPLHANAEGQQVIVQTSSSNLYNHHNHNNY